MGFLSLDFRHSTVGDDDDFFMAVSLLQMPSTDTAIRRVCSRQSCVSNVHINDQIGICSLGCCSSQDGFGEN